jgi:hypothetical protein
MRPRFLPLQESDAPHWTLVTCPRHGTGDIELRQEGAFTEVRCRECVLERDKAE